MGGVAGGGAIEVKKERGEGEGGRRGESNKDNKIAMIGGYQDKWKVRDERGWMERS